MLRNRSPPPLHGPLLPDGRWREGRMCSQYGGEQVIEVMRDAPGESAYGLCSLYMAEMVPHPLPFLDLQPQIPPGRSQALDQRRLLQGAPVQEEDVEERQGHRCQDSSRKRKREVVVTSPAKRICGRCLYVQLLVGQCDWGDKRGQRVFSGWRQGEVLSQHVCAFSRVTVTYSDEEFLRIFASLVYAGHGDGALHAYFGDDEAGDLAVVDLPCYGVGALTPVHGLEEQEGGLELPRLVGQFHPRNGFLQGSKIRYGFSQPRLRGQVQPCQSIRLRG